MTDVTLAAPLYYKHSGRYVPGRLALAILGAVAITLVSATLFAYIEVYMPIGGYVTFLLIFGFGYVVGRGTATLLQRANLRNVKVAASTGFSVGLVAVYWAWVIWVYAYLMRYVPPDQLPENLSIGSLAAHPAELWRIITILNELGPWTLSHDIHPTGIFLSILWLTEAVGIVWMATALPMRKIREVPFCENCQAWGTTRSILQTNVSPDATVRQNIESKNFDFIPALGLAGGSNQWHHYSLQGCANCDTTQTLTVDRYTLTRDKNNKPKTSFKTIVRQLRLTPEETVQICTVAAQMSAPTVPPDEPPPA